MLKAHDTPREVGGAENARRHEPRAVDRAEPSEDHEIAAACERRRMRLLENHRADTERHIFKPAVFAGDMD